MLAYRYLTTSDKSRYNHFVLLREQHLKDGKQLNLYDYRDNDGIECALWPHLYPFHEWCETNLSGNTSPIVDKTVNKTGGKFRDIRSINFPRLPPPPLPHPMLQLFVAHFTLNSTTLTWGRGGGFEVEYKNKTSL